MTSRRTRTDEAIFTRMVDEGMAAGDQHVFRDTRTCACGFQPTTGEDWDRHRFEEQLRAALGVRGAA